MTPGYGYGYGYSLRPMGAAPSGWEPDEIALAWYRSDFGVNVDGDGVWKWEDKTGNGHDLTQSVGSKKPGVTASVLDGFDGITFDAIDDCLNVPALGAASDWTFVFVVRTNVNGIDYYFDGQTDRLIFGLNNSGGWRYRWYDSAWAYYSLVGAPATDLLTFVLGSVAGGKVYKNGVLETLDSGNADYTQRAITGNSAVGSNWGESANFIDMDLMEMLVVPSAISDDERSNLDGYCDVRYPSLGI